jgi:hypothetical protein
MTIMPNHIDRNTLGLIEQLRDALKLADAELQRRCVISSKIRGALSAAEEYLTSRPEDKLSIIYDTPPQIPRL